MPYLGQPQQTQPYRSENVFQAGVQMDTPPDNTPNSVLTAAGNVHLLRQQGSEIILQTEPGMSRAFTIPPNHWVHGWAERAGILYLLLCRFDPLTGLATGEGQLGSWPSPAYAYQSAAANSELVTAGNLINKYQPLRVYYGDFLGQLPTDLISQHFNLSLDNPSELELQDSYDGTLNIIVNDRGHNPALLINSGFAVQPPAVDAADDYGAYQLIVRQGAAQTNRYQAADFTSRLRLHPKSGSLAKAYVTGIADGGRLLGGQYRYYFCYADADGNETGIFAEAGPVPVFTAATPADAHGARDGEPTTQRVILQLSQLDATFGFVRVRYVRRSGEPSALAQAYELVQRLPITPAGTVDFTHTGYEEQAGLSAEQLAATAGSLSRFTTMAQAANRLLVAGIRQDGVDDSVLMDFARSLRLGHQQVSLPGVPGVDSSTDASGTSAAAPSLYTPLNLTGFSGNAMGFTPYSDSRAVWSQGGHLNPLNATYRLGYPSGEAVAFGVRFILTDYSVSDTYPLTGLDNLRGGVSYATLDALAPGSAFRDDGWTDLLGAGEAFNQRGVYRFPLANAGGLQPLLAAGSNAVNILAAQLTVAGRSIPQAVRDKAVGVQFMRAARVPNRLVQGYALPTLRSAITPPKNNVFDQHDNDFRDVLQGKTGNLKVLPTVRGILETVDKDYGNYHRQEKQGVLPFVFNKNTTVGGQTYPLHDPLRMALYAPDALLQPSVWLGRLNQQDIQVQTVGTVYTQRSVGYTNADPGAGISWSLYKSIYQVNAATATLNPGRSFWTLDKQFVVNDGCFGSAEKFLLGKNNSTDEFFLVNLAWTPYVGLRLNTVDLDASGTITSGSTNNTGYGTIGSNVLGTAPEASAYLVNLYDGGGLRTLDTLKQVYDPQSLTYAPISQRLSWDELLGQLDAAGSLLLYGGDTYVHPMYRRLTRALLPGERKDPRFDAHVGQVLSLVCETSAHPATRSDETAGTGSDSNQSFVPRLGAGQSRLDYYREDTTFMQGESSRYNGGYVSESLASPALVQAAPRVSGVPFRAQQFACRVWASAPAIDGSFSNGYRFLPPLSFRDYERSLGEVSRLLPIGDQAALLVHFHGLELLALNERVLTGQGAAGPVYAAGLDFLPPKGKILSRELGCQHPLGVCVTPAGVYGIDAARLVIWFWAIGAERPVRLSDASVSRRLRALLAQYQDGTSRLGFHDVRAVYDSARGDVVFSFYRAVPGAGFAATTNLVYSEPLKAWLGEHDYYKAQALLDVPRRGLFSLPLAGEALNTVGGYSLWHHRGAPAAGAGALRAGGYGHGRECWVEFLVLGSGPDTTKMLDNLVLISEGCEASQLTVTTTEQAAPFVQLLVGPPADITRRNIQRREGHTWITVKKSAKRRGRWIRVRLSWLPAPADPNANAAAQAQDAGRLLKVTSIVRDSFT